MKYKLELVTSKPELWKSTDPVRPELGVSYKTYPGRNVYGLKDESDDYVAFCCVARTWDGSVCVPYTVWSLRKGAGTAIINELLRLIRESDDGIKRVVTLSPVTEMARKFHLKNGAKQVCRNVATVNFEYTI